MNLSLRELESVVRELEQMVVSGQIQELRQPAATTIWMAVRAHGRTVNVLFETARGRARLHAVEGRSATLTPPPAFVSHLRAHLENARIVAVDMPWPDRAVVVRCELGEERRALVLECTSHHPNLFVTDWEGRIQAALRPSDSSRRKLGQGDIYEPPPPGARDVARADRTGGASSASAALEQYFASLEAEEAHGRQRDHRARAVRQELRRMRRALAGAGRDLERAEEWERHLRRGELLKANYGRLRPGAKAVDVVDYWDPQQRVVTLELDPARSPQDNVERCFVRARKGKRGALVAAARAAELDAAAHRLETLLAALEGIEPGTSFDLLDERLARVSPRLRRALEQCPGTTGRTPPAPRRLPYREFIAVSGRAIRVGRGARDNHALIFQHAAPHDVWLHVRGFSGSHVVLPLARGQEPDTETLLDAACLAVHYSKAPDEGFNEVMWTRRKHVRAVKKGAPGQVIVQQEKNLPVEGDPDRLAALLKRRER